MNMFFKHLFKYEKLIREFYFLICKTKGKEVKPQTRKAEGFHHIQTSIARNVKRTSLRRKTIKNMNKKISHTHTHTQNLTNKGKRVIKTIRF